MAKFLSEHYGVTLKQGHPLYNRKVHSVLKSIDKQIKLCYNAIESGGKGNG